MENIIQFRYFGPANAKKAGTALMLAIADKKDAMRVDLTTVKNSVGTTNQLAVANRFPILVPVAEGCVDLCAPRRVIDTSVSLHLSFPDFAVKEIKARVAALAAAFAKGEFDDQLNGFPINPTDTVNLKVTL